ncbi:MAG: hypothetical protein R3338_06690 [Thermoanaerobaculia bacterium]|nr:hypothetical protein [Thermoanaerobaculia bacterium]
MKRTIELVLAGLLLAGPTAFGSDPQEQEKLSQETVPELAGAERVTGPVLVDGELPAPYIDYLVEIGDDQTQKLSIYQNGLVTMATRVGDRTSLKRVLFPPGAVDAYREYLSPELLDRIEHQKLIATPTRMRETIRVFDAEGNSVEREYDPSLYLPSDLERLRVLLQDLARVIIEDNEVTNPLVDYEPIPGDILLDQQMEEWKILQVIDGHIEVMEEGGPLRAWVKTDQLDEQFVSWTRPVSKTE